MNRVYSPRTPEHAGRRQTDTGCGDGVVQFRPKSSGHVRRSPSWGLAALHCGAFSATRHRHDMSSRPHGGTYCTREDVESGSGRYQRSPQRYGAPVFRAESAASILDRGSVSRADAEAIITAGATHRRVLEVDQGVRPTVMSNDVNHVARPYPPRLLHARKRVSQADEVGRLILSLAC